MKPAAASDRRARRIVRLILYPVVLGLVALAWRQHQAAGAGHEPRVVESAGHTVQGRVIAHTVGSKLVFFETDVSVYCADRRHTNPQTYRVVWPRKNTRWVQKGRVVTGVETWMHSNPRYEVNSRLDLRVEDWGVSGTLIVSGAWLRPRVGAPCHAARLGFMAERTPEH